MVCGGDVDSEGASLSISPAKMGTTVVMDFPFILDENGEKDEIFGEGEGIFH